MRVGTRIHNPKPVSSATAGRASGKDLRSTLGHGFAALRADAPRDVRFRLHPTAAVQSRRRCS